MKIYQYICTPFNTGEMLEWLKRHAWKACSRQKRHGGSNPPLSAERMQKHPLFSFLPAWQEQHPDVAAAARACSCKQRTRRDTTGAQRQKKADAPSALQRPPRQAEREKTRPARLIPHDSADKPHQDITAATTPTLLQSDAPDIPPEAPVQGSGQHTQKTADSSAPTA